MTQPHFEQVAQEEPGVDVWLRQRGQDARQGRRVFLMAVRVRDEPDLLPVRRRGDLVGADGTGRVPSWGQTISTAFSITTGATGTSEWKPWRPVCTPLMASTISVPAVTWLKTA